MSGAEICGETKRLGPFGEKPGAERGAFQHIEQAYHTFAFWWRKWAV